MFRPKKLRNLADAAKDRFSSTHGDLVRLLEVYNSWKYNMYEKTWCKTNFVNCRALEQAYQIREQLVEVMAKYVHQFRISDLSSKENYIFLKYLFFSR